MKKITADHLRDLKACPKQVALFELFYPDGVELTRDNLLAAAIAGLDVGWYARRTLPSRSVYERATDAAAAALRRAEFDAWAQFDHAVVEAKNALHRAKIAAWPTPDRLVVEAECELDRVRSRARAEYQEATAAARKTYRLAEAAAFADTLGLAVELEEVQS